jgi:hypothetical protein
LTIFTAQPNARHFSSSGSLLHHVAGAAADLQRVAVNDRREVVEVVMRGGHGGLPVRAFGQFAVAQQGEHAVRRVASILPAMAMPTQMGRPWPSAPVFISMPGMWRVGWPTNAGL